MTHRSPLWLLMVLLLCRPLAATAADTLIIPGLRVGPAVLGDTVEALTRKAGVGQPYRSKVYTNLLYRGYTVVVNTSGRQVVQAIVVTDPPYHLKNGIGIGTSEKQVRKLLGKPAVVQTMTGHTNGMIDRSMNYQKLGLTLAFAKEKVVEISIYPRKTSR